jgi:elongation factor Ts
VSTISPSDVKALRERTGAGMMDCKAALAEAEGDVDRAIEILRVKGQASAAKRSGRTTSEGVIASYIHATGKVGAMVEVQCETDFVARTDEFRDFAREVAVHVAGAPTPPHYVATEEIPDADREAERNIHARKAREDGKPDDVIDKIVSGQLGKWEKQIALLEQEHINSDRYEGKTIGELRTEIAAMTSENVRIARFARFVVGEE